MENEMLFNKTEKTAFLSELEAGRLSHAYLIEGDDGVGKTYFAMLAAKAVLCTGNAKPCNRCPSCVKVNAGSHPDLFYFSPDKKASLGVDTVREIKKSVWFTPNDGPKKAYVIDDAEKMTVQAQNALLKFLEEPPESTVFFLVTDKKESLLPTVVSRTRLITLRPSDEDDIMTFLRTVSKGADDAQLYAAVAMAEGSIGRAERLIGKEVSRQRKLCLDFLPIMLGTSRGDMIAFLLSMKQNREGVKEFFSLLLTAVSDMTNVKLGFEKTRLLTPEAAHELARKVTDRRLAYLYDIVTDAAVRASENANLNLLLTAFAARL